MAPIGKSDRRGVVVVTLVADVDESDDSESVRRSQVVGLMSVRVPDRSVQSRSELIQWSVLVRDKADEVVVDDSGAN